MSPSETHIRLGPAGDLCPTSWDYPSGVNSQNSVAELGKAGADEHDGQLSLSNAVKGCDQRGQLVLLNVLQLIDEQDQGRSSGLGCFSSGLEERLQVVFQVSKSRPTWMSSWWAFSAHEPGQPSESSAGEAPKEWISSRWP